MNPSKLIYLKELSFTHLEDYVSLFTLIYDIYKDEYPDSNLNLNEIIEKHIRYLKVPNNGNLKILNLEKNNIIILLIIKFY